MQDNNKKYKKFLGIDVGKYIHYASLIEGAGKVIKKGVRLDNTREGFDGFEEEFSEHKDQMLIGMEPTGHYWKSLASFLKEKGYQVVLVNTYHVKLNKEMIDNSQRKTDKKDSIVIADLLRTGKYFNFMKLSNDYLDLRKLTVAREKMVQEFIRAKLRLNTVLEEYLPEYEKCFCSIAGATSLGLLEKYGIKGLKNFNNEDFEQDVLRLSKKKIRLGRIKVIESLLKTSIGHESGLVGAEEEINIWIKEIRHWQKEMKDIEKKLETILEKVDEAKWLLSIKGVGKLTASIILGQTGSFKNYSNYKKLEKLAGLNLVENSSGTHYGIKKLSKRGRNLLRHALYRVGIVAIAKNPDMKALYIEKLKQGKTKMVALTNIIIKLLRIMFALVKNQEIFDSNKLLLAKANS